MKLFFSEFRADYGRYHFPYQVWLLREEGDTVEKIYENGFLPIRNKPNVYYLSRNVRVDLSLFELSSENRRILKKTEFLKTSILPLSEFMYTPEIQKLCKDYAENRFGTGKMSTYSIKNIFTGEIFNYVFVFQDSQSGKDIGFAVCYISDSILQFAHSFYDLNYLDQSIGARMILQAIIWAKDNGKKYAYLGTCYEGKALYKTEFSGVEFFNGFGWSRNLAELKALLKRENEEYLLKDKDYLDNFHEGDLHKLLNKYGVRVSF